MNKRKKLTLIIGFTIILITFVLSLVALVYEYVTVETEPGDPFPIEKIIFPFYFFFFFPIILHELSLLRSAHKLINFTPGTVAKICLVVSIVISTAALAFELLAYTGIITQDIFPKAEPGPGAASQQSSFILLWFFLGWPLFWVSFAFGSAICSRKEQQNDSWWGR